MMLWTLILFLNIMYKLEAFAFLVLPQILAKGFSVPKTCFHGPVSRI